MAFVAAEHVICLGLEAHLHNIMSLAGIIICDKVAAAKL